jgi:hypothetical protein
VQKGRPGAQDVETVNVSDVSCGGKQCERHTMLQGKVRVGEGEEVGVEGEEKEVSSREGGAFCTAR